MAEIPYLEQTPSNWAEVIDGWKWGSISASKATLNWSKSGLCPRCKHEMSVDLGLIQTFNDQPPKFVDAYCNCTADHKGGTPGCGAFGNVSAPKESK